MRDHVDDIASTLPWPAPVLSQAASTPSSSPWYNTSCGPPITEDPQVNYTCGSSDQNFKYMAYTLTYSVVFPVGFVCNSAALFVFLRLTRKRTANTVFMVNLALSDVGFSLTLPFRLVYYFRDCLWDFPDWLCRLCVFAFYVNLYTSVLFLTGLSVLRYVAIVHPLRNRRLVTVKRAVWACVSIWLFVALLSVPFLMSGTLVRGGQVRCFEPDTPKSWFRILVLNYVALVLGFLLPFLTILGCYGSIILKLLNGPKVPQRSLRKRRRSTYLMAVILSTFLLCFLPYHLLRSLHVHAMVQGWDYRVTAWLLRLIVVTLCLAASNSCLNPLLYYFAGESFRTTVRTHTTIRSSSFNTTLNQGSFRSTFGWRRTTHTPTNNNNGHQMALRPGTRDSLKMTSDDEL
ncbi:cysteinyl leukotriene receptor 2 [Engraulis encrasicolus]|uniref:cysteinyl leukotriene receptor 2 n=1 Tax=Engraulis encrasicolus TaxID=184585 RepID=UPI002FD2B4DD